MKTTRLFSILLSVGMVLMGVSGCTSSKSDDGKLSVVASFYPMYDFAQKIGGDKVTVTNLTPAGVEPHEWEPKSTDMITISDADVFIYNSEYTEGWVTSVLDSLDSKSLTIVKASADITLLQTTDSENGEESGSDGHVWLDPEYAKIEMQAICEAFCKADPTNKSYYEDNLATYSEKLDQLDADFTEALADVTQKNIVVAHQAFGYLCSAYGLTQIPIEGLSADAEPDANRMMEIIDFVEEYDIHVIFFEELVNPEVAQAIADETGCETAALNPLEGISDDDIAAGQDYFTVMESNLDTLVAALS